MARTHVMQRAPTPLYAMPAAEIAALVLAVGDCIEYRTLAMLPEEQPRVCCIHEIRENGTLVLDDETWISRTRLTWLKLHKVEMARDTAGADDADDQPDPSDQPDLAPEPPAPASPPAASAGTTSRPQDPAGCKTRRQPAVQADGTCRDCAKPFTRTSNVQKACPDCTRAKAAAYKQELRARQAAETGKSITPRADATVIAARCELLSVWNVLRSRLGGAAAAAQLDTPENRAVCRAKHITKDILGWYANQYKALQAAGTGEAQAPQATRRPQDPASEQDTSRTSQSELGPTPAAGNADLPIGSRADPVLRTASVGAPMAASLAARLMFVARRIGAAEDLVARATAALQMLEAYPEAGE